MIFILIILLYAGLILVYAYSFITRRNQFIVNNFTQCIPISIIIPIRNEENNIVSLLNSISKLNYPVQCFEILIIDDHSNDKSISIIKKYIEKTNISIKLISLENNESGKKKAILKGIQNASFDILITTDADCEHHPDWLMSMSSFYQKYKPDMVIGPVFFAEKKGILYRMLFIEQLSLVASTAASALLNKPIMCSGANLLFSKTAYISSYNLLHFYHPSGDDMFLLHSFKKNSNKIMYNASPQAIVYTQPPISLTDFVQQRKRWVSKAKYYRDFSTIYVALLVTLANFSLIISLFMAACGFFSVGKFVILFAVKTIVNYFLLKATAIHYYQNFSIIHFLMAQLLYPWYVVFFAIYGNFGNFKWKNR